MARPVHFELPVDDQERAAAFYQELFGWEIHRWEGAPYWLVTSGPDTEPGINGALARRSKELSVPVFVVQVDDIDVALASAEAAGATVVVGKNPIAAMGYSAYFDDTEGNRVGLFQADESATA